MADKLHDNVKPIYVQLLTRALARIWKGIEFHYRHTFPMSMERVAPAWLRVEHVRGGNNVDVPVMSAAHVRADHASARCCVCALAALRVLHACHQGRPT